MAKRRGNGEGSITKRKDGRWMGRYTVHAANGSKQKPIYGKTRAEVAEKLTKAMADRNGGLVFDADNLKLGEYLERWLKDSVRDAVRPTTFERYEQIVRIHIGPALGAIKLKALTPAHVRGLYREKLDTGLASRTVNYIHRTLFKALKQAVADGLIPRNAADAVKPPQIRREEMRPLTPQQVKLLLEAAHGDRLEALYVLAIHTGLRQGELLGLKWDDVDLETGTLRVCRTLATTQDGPQFTTPKTTRSRRSIKLTQSAADALKQHLERQLVEIEGAGSLWEENGLIFASEIGEPLDRRFVTTHRFKPLLKRAGLPQVRFHDLRHTATYSERQRQDSLGDAGARQHSYNSGCLQPCAS
jgi:integrase